MESNAAAEDPGPQDLLRTADEAEAAASRWAGTLRLPSLFYSSLGVAVAVQIFTAAWGIATNDGVALAALGAGALVFIGVGATQLARFRRLNGVWVGGLASRVVLGSAGAASTAYVLSLGGSLWAALSGHWWLAAVCAGLGGAGYALSGIRWWRKYQQLPSAHASAESLAWLVAAGALALLGTALLLAVG